MQRSGAGIRAVARAVAGAAVVVVVAVLMSGCSSEESSALAEEWQREFCTNLGAWQDAKRAAPGLDDAESAGQAVISASKRLDREGLEQGGGHILDDTVNAVGGDVGAERRAVSYCDSAGFETLVGSAG